MAETPEGLKAGRYYGDLLVRALKDGWRVINRQGVPVGVALASLAAVFAVALGDEIDLRNVVLSAIGAAAVVSAGLLLYSAILAPVRMANDAATRAHHAEREHREQTEAFEKNIADRDSQIMRLRAELDDRARRQERQEEMRGLISVLAGHQGEATRLRSEVAGALPGDDLEAMRATYVRWRDEVAGLLAAEGPEYREEFLTDSPTPIAYQGSRERSNLMVQWDNRVARLNEIVREMRSVLD